MIVIFMINIIVTRFCDRSSRTVSLSFCTQCHLSLLLCRRPHRSIQKQKCRNTKTNTCWLPHRLLLIPNLQIVSPSTSTIHKRSWLGNHLPAPPGLHHSVLWQEKASCHRFLTDHQISSEVFSRSSNLVTGYQTIIKSRHRFLADDTIDCLDENPGTNNLWNYFQALPSVVRALGHSSLPRLLTGESYHHQQNHDHDHLHHLHRLHHHDHHHDHHDQAADDVLLANSFVDPWRDLHRQLLLRPAIQTYSWVLQGWGFWWFLRWEISQHKLYNCFFALLFKPIPESFKVGDTQGILWLGKL